MANPQQEMQKSFARVLGYDGPMQGFGNYIQSDPAISEKYRGMLAIAEKQRDMAKQNMMKMSQSPKPQMAQGGYIMDRFQQNQQQDMVGGYVPPPQQSFNVGGAVGNPADMEQFPIAEAQLGGNMIPAGQGDQTATLQSGAKQGLSLPQPTVQGGVKTIATAQPPKQAFQDVQRPVYDTNQFLDDGTTPNPNYGQPIMDAEGNPLTTTEAPNIGEMGAQMITQPGLPTGAAVEAVGVDPGTGQFLQTSVGGVTPSGVAVQTTLADTAPVQQH